MRSGFFIRVMKQKNDISAQKPLHLAIQGYEGSFHQLAAKTFYGEAVTVECCDTFKEVIKAAKDSNRTDGCVMAIENSIAGSILPNYKLIQGSNLKIVGEVYLQINQNLLVNPGVKLEDIKEVHSHTMALQQCYEYLDQYNWKLVETDDTALSAKHITKHKSKHIAAIASTLAAKLFDLNVLAPNIQTLKNNYTRFLILKRQEDILPISEADKASINFQTDHTRGSLAKVLTTIAKQGINLSKLQSFPIPGSAFKYQFHADMEFEVVRDFDKVIEKIKSLTTGVKIYGVYKKGLWK